MQPPPWRARRHAGKTVPALSSAYQVRAFKENFVALSYILNIQLESGLNVYHLEQQQ